MLRQQTQELDTGVARAADNADLDHVGLILAMWLCVRRAGARSDDE
jgi:hypothetical protein